jgi:hypothetical protein
MRKQLVKWALRCLGITPDLMEVMSAAAMISLSRINRTPITDPEIAFLEEYRIWETNRNTAIYDGLRAFVRRWARASGWVKPNGPSDTAFVIAHPSTWRPQEGDTEQGASVKARADSVATGDLHQHMRRTALPAFKFPSWIHPLNALLQIFFVRIEPFIECTDWRALTADSFVLRSQLLYGVVPFTGWRSPYRFIGGKPRRLKLRKVRRP